MVASRASGLMRDRLVVFLASGGWIGYVPWAPGTFGTLVAVPLALPFAWLHSASGVLYLLVLFFLVGVACWIAGRAEALFGEHDAGKIVIDEIVGYLVALCFLPATVPILAAAFVLFRVFDVWKPFPAAWLDRNVPGGGGVVLDDVAAGIYTAVALHLARYAGWLS